MKYCSGCKKTKTIKEFHLDRSNLDKHSYICKSCTQYKYKKYYKKHRKVIIQKQKDRLAKPQNKLKRQKYLKKYRKKVKVIQTAWRYNLTQEQLLALCAKFKYKCGICGKSLKLKATKIKHKQLCIDHNHKTKKVRGILCGRCNLAIGNFADSIKLLQKAVKYLKKFNNKKESD